MLRCVQTASPENFAVELGGDMSVLERQRSMLQRIFEQQLQLQNLQRISCSPSPSPSPSSSQTTAMPLPLFQGQSFMNNSQNFGFACSDITTVNASVHSSRSQHHRKRKAEEEDDQFKDKRGEGGETGESDSGITVKSEKENSGKISGENSKEVVQNHKTEFIHVRARRGQATDSHSLAERARREKISKKMKCLQDLVPGCNKVTGKAGMLDEIINYVQSLQKQVEFLSMKLASLNPRLDFNMDSFFPKEIPGYVGGGFPTSMEMAQPGMFPYNVQESSSSGIDLATHQMLPKTAAFPEAYLDSLSTLSQIQQMSTALDTDWQSLFSSGFHQG